VLRDELLAYCLSKPGAWQDEPWDGDTVVKVAPKIFAVRVTAPRPTAASGRVRRHPRGGRRVAHADAGSYRMILAKLPKRDRPAEAHPGADRRVDAQPRRRLRTRPRRHPGGALS